MRNVYLIGTAMVALGRFCALVWFNKRYYGIYFAAQQMATIANPCITVILCFFAIILNVFSFQVLNTLT